MNVWNYRACDAQGRIMRGRMDAHGVRDLEMRLRGRGLELLRHARVRDMPWVRRSRRIGRRELIHFCFHMEQSARAGVPLLDSLRDLHGDGSAAGLRRSCRALVESIEGGNCLSDALQAVDMSFPPMFISMIRAGEKFGDLEAVFSSLGQGLKWQDEQWMQIRRLLMYPAFVLFIVIAVGTFLMVWLVPQLVEFMRGMNQDLPLHTRALIWTSETIVRWWPLLVGLAVGLLIIAAQILIHSPMARLYVDIVLLRLPLAGTLAEKAALARVSLFFAMLYAAGLTIPECLGDCARIVGNRAFGKALREASDKVSSGESLGGALRKDPLFPSLFIRFVDIGERTGTLEDALRNAHYFYQRDVREAIDRLQAAVEPVTTVVLGALLAWLMFSILGPIYDLLGKIQF